MAEVELALVIATVFIGAATAVLAWATWNLVRATRQLSVAEHRRLEEDARRERYALLGRKAELARQVVGMRWKRIGNTLSGGSEPVRHSTALSKLHDLLDYEEDTVDRGEMRELLEAFDAARDRATFDAGTLKDLEATFRRIKDDLMKDIPRWREEISGLAPWEATLSGRDAEEGGGDTGKSRASETITAPPPEP